MIKGEKDKTQLTQIYTDAHKYIEYSSPINIANFRQYICK